MPKVKNQYGEWDTDKKIGGPTKKRILSEKLSRANSKLTQSAIDRLAEAFSIDATIEEATFYAGIDVSTYFLWKKREPKKFEQLERLKLNPVLKARREVVNNLVGFDNSLRYLERKRKGEFSLRTETLVDNSRNYDLLLKKIEELDSGEKKMIDAEIIDNEEMASISEHTN